MIFWTRFFSIVIFLCLSGISATQAAPRCESIFLPTVLEVIQQVDAANNRFLLHDSSIEQIGKDFSWLRRRKLRKLINNTDLQSFVSEKAVERYAVELGVVLFGNKETVSRFLHQDKESRLEESTIILIKEKLLKEGLVRTWGETFDPRDAGVFRKSMDRLWTFSQHRVLEWLRIPFSLPSLKNSEIPPELMYKIIRDGFNVHAEEVRIALKAQNKIEAYNTFRKVYSRVFFATLIAFQVHTGYHQIQAYQKQQVETTVQQIQNIRQQAEHIAATAKQEQFEIAYKGAEADFIQKWGEPPTAAEREVLRKKIAEALNYELPQ